MYTSTISVIITLVTDVNDGETYFYGISMNVAKIGL